MTNSSSAKGKGDAVNDHGWFNVSVKILGAAAALIGITVGIITIARSVNSKSASPSPPVTTSTTPSSQTSLLTGSSSAGSTARLRLSVGACLDSKHDAVSCSASHVAEVFAQDNCSQTALLAYLGGQVGVDTLLPGIPISKVAQSGSSACIVTLPAQSSRSSSNQSVLTSAAGGGWRECLAGGDPNFSIASCLVPHRAEIVYSGEPKPNESLDCAQRADEYMNTDTTSAPGDLAIDVAQRNGVMECVVSLRSNDQLTQSLRRLGTQTLPIASN
jgi:hypothetical protein